MNVLSGRYIPWLMGSVAVLAIIAAVFIGQMMSTDAPPPIASVQPDQLAESSVPLAPSESSLFQAPPELTVEEQTPQGPPSVSPQTSVPTSITIDPVEDWNPVKTQHTFTVTVREADGSPAAGAAVEFILNRFSGAVDGNGNIIYSVGDIVSLGGNGPHKVDNHYGLTSTNATGQATVTITATREGDTDVTAYAPGILDNDTHKVFAVKHWIDKDIICNPLAPAPNQAGTSHDMTITVFRASSGMDVDGYPAHPLAGETTEWRITDNDPAATFVEGSSVTERTVTTGADGTATLTLYQVSPIPGDNAVTVSVVDSENRPMFSCTFPKQWVAGTLAVTKTASPEVVNIGEPVTFTIDVTNLSSEGSLTGVDVADVFPFASFDNIAYNIAPDSDSAGALAWEDLDLAAGATMSFTISGTATAVGTHTNTVTVTSTEDPTEKTANASVTVRAPEVSVTKTVDPEQILVGEQATFTIVVTNNNPDAAANNVVITDVLDEGLTQISSDLATSIPQLAAGESQTYTIVVQADQRGDFTNEVTVDWDERELSGQSEQFASATVTALLPTIEIEKTGRPVLYTGQIAPYTLTVTNTGDADLTGVVITDTFPSQMSYVSSTGGGTASGNVVTWPAVNLPVGGTHSVTVTLRGDTAGEPDNMASVTTTERATDDDSLGIRIIPAAGADINIVDNPDPALVGELVTFTITVDNQGSTAPMTNIQVVVTLNDHWAIQSAGAGTISDNGATFNLDTVGAGQTHTFTVTAEAIEEGSGQATATLTYQEFGGTNEKTQGTTIIAQ